MATVTGVGTTFDLPNYPGELFEVSPSDTPFLSLIGGLVPLEDQIVHSTSFGWQTQDLRDPSVRARLEGADAPTAEERSRANVTNVLQIFQETVATSYTKRGTNRMTRTPGSAPFNSVDGDGNPIVDEHTHQVMLALKQVARDANFAFWHGRFNSPTSNAEARQTRGMLQAITTNRSADGEITGLTTGASDVINETTTGLSNGDKIVFTVPPAELSPTRVYYVVNKATDAFKVALTSGGAAITIATGQSGIAYIPAATALTATTLNELMQDVYDAGGISEQETATLFTGSTQKSALSAAFADAYGKTDLFSNSRDVAGRNLQTIDTDFGRLNVVLERALPKDALVVASLDQVKPKFLEIPGKGVLFEEDLAKTGASDKTQLYGEMGLEYGAEIAHGVIRGLAA